MFRVHNMPDLTHLKNLLNKNLYPEDIWEEVRKEKEPPTIENFYIKYIFEHVIDKLISKFPVLKKENFEMHLNSSYSKLYYHYFDDKFELVEDFETFEVFFTNYCSESKIKKYVSNIPNISELIGYIGEDIYDEELFEKIKTFDKAPFVENVYLEIVFNKVISKLKKEYKFLKKSNFHFELYQSRSSFWYENGYTEYNLLDIFDEFIDYCKQKLKRENKKQ